MGAQKNRLIETVLLSTHNIGFVLEIRISVYKNLRLTGGLQTVYKDSLQASRGLILTLSDPPVAVIVN